MSMQSLRLAIREGSPDRILAAIPEPPEFLAVLFSLEPGDRDAILAGVVPLLPTDEDRWEIIEAAAQDSILRPERQSFIAVIPYISLHLMDDARVLAMRFPHSSMRDVALTRLDARANEV
jgi:hypothetical protein